MYSREKLTGIWKLKTTESNLRSSIDHSIGEKENLSHFERWRRRCSDTWLFRHYRLIHSCKNEEKTVLSISVLKTYLSGIFLYKMFCHLGWTWKISVWILWLRYLHLHCHISAYKNIKYTKIGYYVKIQKWYYRAPNFSCTPGSPRP